MTRFTRRRFIAAVSAVAGSLTLDKRSGFAHGQHVEPDDLKLWYNEPASRASGPNNSRLE
jgi:hypothetical protein